MPFLISSIFCIVNVLSSFDVEIYCLPIISLKWSFHSLIRSFPLFALSLALFELSIPLISFTIFKAKADFLYKILLSFVEMSDISGVG